jgi:hypothetical protein
MSQPGKIEQQQQQQPYIFLNLKFLKFLFKDFYFVLLFLNATQTD